MSRNLYKNLRLAFPDVLWYIDYLKMILKLRRNLTCETYPFPAAFLACFDGPDRLRRTEGPGS